MILIGQRIFLSAALLPSLTGSLKYYRTEKHLDDSVKTGVMCVRVFVGA